LIAAFYLLAGYGIGVALLAAWLPAGAALAAVPARRTDGQPDAALADRSSVAEDLARVLLFGVIVLLYRLFTERFQDQLTGVALTDNFALFSFLLGAVLPAMLAGILRPPRAEATASGAVHLARLFVTVLAGAAAASLLLVLWGARSAIGLLTGLAISLVVDWIAVAGVRKRGASTLSALLALLVAVALVQWTGSVLGIAVITRAEKIRFVAWLAGLLLLALVVTDYGGRLGRRRRTRQSTAVAPGGAGQ
jgi:hypothetical protein